LKVLLLGSPQIERDGRPVEIDRRKAIALIAYLALTHQEHRREALATLLWPEYSQDRAHANLRLTLWSLQKAVGHEWLDAEQETVSLRRETGFWLDVDAFRSYVAECQSRRHAASEMCSECLSSLTAAVELYRNDFMAGFTLRDSPDFDDWQLFQAEGLRRELAGALEKMVRYHAAQGEFEVAIRYARRWLRLDPTHEPAHRELMHLYHWSGQRSAALHQYRECVSILEDELGIAPEEETTALYQAIQEKRAEPPAPIQAAPGQPLHTAPVTPEGRNRYNMLRTVRTFWIEGVLENSLHGAALLELGMKQETGVVDHPWDTLLRMPGLTDRTLPAGTRISDVFDKLNGKFLILGDPGSGKTTILLELARDLLRRAAQDGAYPIPVVFNLASWSQHRKPLAGWLVDELRGRYQVPKEVAEEWVEGDALLLLLDGLDEVSAAQRGDCVEAINTYREEHGFVDVVVCSRSAEYQALTHKLRLNGGVVLLPLTDTQIDAYFTSLGPEMGGVRALMAADANLRLLCRSPLMLSILVLAYRGTSARDMLEFDTLETQRRHLFDVYVERMFERRPGEKPYSPRQTVHYLGWLAKHMLESRLAVFHVEDLRPTWLTDYAQQRGYRLAVALAFGLLDGLIVGAAIGLPVAVAAGLSAGLAAGLLAVPSWGLMGWLAARRGVELQVSALVTLLVLAAASALVVISGEPFFALVVGLATGLVAGMRFVEIDVRVAPERQTRQPVEEGEAYMQTAPGLGVRRSVQRAIRHGLASGIIAGVAAGLAAGLAGGPFVGLVGGLVAGLTVGLIAASASKDSRAVVRHYVLRSILYRNGYVPRNYTRLLDYAVHLIILRRVGDGYIFVHRYLTEYFARLERA